MITTHEPRRPRSPWSLPLKIAHPLTVIAHTRAIERGKDTLLDLDEPAFVRRILSLGLPVCDLGSRRDTVPAPIAKLLKVVLGQDGILFPIEET